MNNGNNPSRELVVIRQPEEQHRARYASEGSRGAVKDRSGTSYCSIQLNGYYRPTRVEILAAEREYSSNVPSFVPHSQYKLVPVLGKSATMTPCRKIIKNNGSECLEIILRPENRMIGILDCIGIMKICAYNNNKTVKNNYEQESNKEDKQNCGKVENYEIIEAVTEPIKCVHQVGNPDILKISLESCPSSGGQELFIIGRNFDPKDTNVLFREYKNDGSLGWTAKAVIDKRFLHQCYIVCTIPPYRSNCRGAAVSLLFVGLNKVIQLIFYIQLAKLKMMIGDHQIALFLQMPNAPLPLN
uniref:RHD domain-containing protein n=1 Tax=Meloidogyne javanica TaxID=6303 RepID=A0A915MRF4_MELJA